MTDNPDLVHWNSKFSGDDYAFGTEPNLFLAAHKDLLRPGMSALAIADGEGRNGVWLAEQGLKVLSVDFSPMAVQKARRLAQSRGVDLEFQQADITIWDWPIARYDVVAAIFFQFATPEQRAAIFTGIKQALKPGGLLLLQGYRPEQLGYGTGGPAQVEKLYTADLLRRAFGDFEIRHLAEHDSHLTEGSAHAGMSALIDLVAYKPGP